MKRLLPILILIALDIFLFIKPVNASPIYDAEKKLIDDIVVCYKQLEENPYCSRNVLEEVKSFANEWGELDDNSTIIILAGLEIDGESGLSAIENMIILLSLAAICDDIDVFRTSMLCDWANWAENTPKTPDNG
tara:strand:+ start:427 stop:828 length:402 start_codon:yes stop_codon:yes gene_type:complete